MLSSLPSTSISNILDYLSSRPSRFSSRNRCLFALRPFLRTYDVASLRLRQVINPADGTINHYFVSRVDRQRFHLNALTRSELELYLRQRFGVNSDESLKQVLSVDPNAPLFPTQQRNYFSHNTLQQLYSHLSKIVDRHFSTVHKKTIQTSNEKCDASRSHLRLI